MENNSAGCTLRLISISIIFLTMVYFVVIINFKMIAQKMNPNYLIQSLLTETPTVPMGPLDSKIILFWTGNYLPDQSSNFNCSPYQCQYTKNRSQFNQSDGVIFEVMSESKYCIYIFIYMIYFPFREKENVMCSLYNYLLTIKLNYCTNFCYLSKIRNMEPVFSLKQCSSTAFLLHRCILSGIFR